MNQPQLPADEPCFDCGVPCVALELDSAGRCPACHAAAKREAREEHESDNPSSRVRAKRLRQS